MIFFSFFFGEHTADKKVFGIVGGPEKGREKFMAVLEPHDDAVLPLLPSSSFTSPCPPSSPGGTSPGNPSSGSS